jgi:Calcineurin-like phosphoesterase
MTSYDIIGDIHGSADKLEGLLRALGYAEVDGAYRLDGHQAVFVGDLIDRGDDQVRVLEVVRAMDEAGSARVVMGNHEFNAIAWVTPHPHVPGEFMRTHLDRRGAHNRRHHSAFLAQVGEGSALHASTIEWFRTMPLYLDLGGLRIAHACWHPASLAVLDKWVPPGTPVTDEFIVEASTRYSEAFDAVEVVLKGPEVRLPEHLAFLDPEDAPRWAARIKWWDGTATSLGELAIIPGGSRTLDGDPHPGLPDAVSDHADEFRYTDTVPVFFGHYWFRGTPRPAAERAVCVDYSAVRPGRSLVAYRWSGEDVPTADRFVAFPGDIADAGWSGPS